jgi:hypothetical protein
MLIKFRLSYHTSFNYSLSVSEKGYPDVAKALGLQSQGAKGEAVISYREPLATQDLESSGFPERANIMTQSN